MRHAAENVEFFVGKCLKISQKLRGGDRKHIKVHVHVKNQKSQNRQMDYFSTLSQLQLSVSQNWPVWLVPCFVEMHHMFVWIIEAVCRSIISVRVLRTRIHCGHAHALFIKMHPTLFMRLQNSVRNKSSSSQVLTRLKYSTLSYHTKFEKRDMVNSWWSHELVRIWIIWLSVKF